MWIPAVHAALYVGFIPLFRVKILGCGLILLRHFMPVKNYLLYGSLIFLKPNQVLPDGLEPILQSTMKIIFFFIMNDEEWFPYFLLAFIIVINWVYKESKFLASSQNE